jgi:hypothetical protein
MTQETMTLPGFSPSISNLAMNSGRIVLFIVFTAMLIGTLHPELRASLRGTILYDFRVVVSTAHGDLLGEGIEMKVAKVRTRDALFVEVYEPRGEGNMRLLERIELQDKRDGYFNFNGQATNLAIDDIDGDGRPEILAPSFDQNLIGHINVYRYDKTLGAFQRALR